jgi:hypothetical protein
MSQACGPVSAEPQGSDSSCLLRISQSKLKTYLMTQQQNTEQFNLKMVKGFYRHFSKEDRQMPTKHKMLYKFRH